MDDGNDFDPALFFCSWDDTADVTKPRASDTFKKDGFVRAGGVGTTAEGANSSTRSNEHRLSFLPPFIMNDDESFPTNSPPQSTTSSSAASFLDRRNDAEKALVVDSTTQRGHMEEGTIVTATTTSKGASRSASTGPSSSKGENGAKSAVAASQPVVPTIDHLLPLSTNVLNSALLPLAYHALAAAGATTNLDPSAKALVIAQQQKQLSKAAPSAASASFPSASSALGSATAATATDPANLPPFLLFDAPVELRNNFIQSQRAHGIVPTLDDHNSIHYELVVNGSHPHMSMPLTTSSTDGINTGVRLIDGRHGHVVGHKRVKNEREQKRTQKIADLIDHLREKMERGGWKVGVKSKFQTLSSCAEYVNHLIQVNKEKEEAVERARNDLEAKRRKVEEDRNNQQDPSDPESTTSSLTVSSGSEGRSENKGGNKTDSDRKPSTEESREMDDSDDSERKSKKRRLGSHESTPSSSTSSGGDDSGNQRLGVHSVACDPVMTSVSDLTDSNKGSSSGELSSRKNTRRRRRSLGTNNVSRNSCDTVSSDAAVARGLDKGGRVTDHSDVVIKGRKRKVPCPSEATTRFQLDYEDVFLNSTIPQVLATTSGRIIAWNKFFLKVTGLTENNVHRSTIFSLVKSTKLSCLFEIVAAALRTGTMNTENEGVSSQIKRDRDLKMKLVKEKAGSNDSSDKNGSDSNKNKWKYSAITLPCTTFPSQVRRQGDKKCPGTDRPFYITVTLMTDEDPRNRCFHCVFTDRPPATGLRPVTPELLSMMFTTKPKQPPVDSKVEGVENGAAASGKKRCRRANRAT